MTTPAHRLINGPDELAALCAQIRRAPRVAIDTEFHNEKSYAARLMVVQLAFEDEVVVVDPLAGADLRPLAQALGATTVVGHALSSDLKIFADRFDTLPAAAFDTQLAAAFCGYGMSISLADLVDAVAGVRLRKTQTVSDWSTRPLSEKQIDYLVNDVAYLFVLADALSAKLAELGRREWFEEEARELVDPAEYRPDPERLYMRIPGANRLPRRELGVLRELARLRDQLARERDVPPKYIIPDDVLAGLVHLRPDARDELAQLRRFDAGMRKAFGDQILAAIARGLALPEAELPVRPARGLPAAREAIVTLMGVLIGTIALQHDLPAALLAPRAKLERVARDLPRDRAALEGALGLGGWRTALVVEPLWQLLSGRLTLGIDGFAGGAPSLSLHERARE